MEIFGTCDDDATPVLRANDRAHAAMARPSPRGLPQRIGQLTDGEIVGTRLSDPIRAHVALYEAHAYIDKIHRHECNADARVLWKRMPTRGVSNDLNSVIRSFAISVRDERQLVILPPSLEMRKHLPRHKPLHAHHPWHWLSEGVPLSAILHPSACQDYLLHGHADALNMLGANESDASSTKRTRAVGLAAFAGPRSRDHNAVNKWFVELRPKDIPRPFRSHGMLWWFRALTTYLVRVRDPIAHALQRHPAMLDIEPWGDRAQSSMLGHSAPWFPPIQFDVGLHVRVGDACGSHAVFAPARSGKMRHCVTSFEEALTRVRASNASLGGTLFVASDSQAIIDEAKRTPHPPFERVIALSFRRDRYETGKLVEEALGRDTDNSVLEEALLELLCLSRARAVAGAMNSNMPRLAMQLAARPPGVRPAYISTDGNQWCTTSSCKAALPKWVAEGMVKHYPHEAKGGHGLNR